MEQRLAAAGAAVEQVSALLVRSSATTLDRASYLLAAIVTEVADARRELGPSDRTPEVRDAAFQLAAGVRRASRILQGGLDFFENWNRRMGEITGGYNVQGEPSPARRLGRVSVHG
ncbi:MAG TPA: hypothetical protein VGF59_23685 [Bryobacteraceae bacterium]|jgi:hypothetical protein